MVLILGWLDVSSVDAVLGRFCQTFAYCLYNLVGVKISLIDHAVDSYLWEAIKSKFGFLSVPLLECFVRIEHGIDLCHVNLLYYFLNTVIDYIPVADTIFIKKIHVLQPLLYSFLFENLVLMQLL